MACKCGFLIVAWRYGFLTVAALIRIRVQFLDYLSIYITIIMPLPVSQGHSYNIMAILATVKLPVVTSSGRHFHWWSSRLGRKGWINQNRTILWRSLGFCSHLFALKDRCKRIQLNTTLHWPNHEARWLQRMRKVEGHSSPVQYSSVPVHCLQTPISLTL